MPNDALYPNMPGSPPPGSPAPEPAQPGTAPVPSSPPPAVGGDNPADQPPTDAAGYRVELPADIQLPEGVNFAVADDDPLLAEARAWAHANGLTQQQFSGLLAMRAKMDVAAHEAWAAHQAAEMKALGDKAADRVSAATTFLRSKLPADQFEALKGAVMSAKAVEAIETLMTLASGPKLPASPGAPLNSNSGGDTLSALYPSMKKA